MKKLFQIFILVFTLIWFSALVLGCSKLNLALDNPPQPTPTVDRLAEPPIPDPPSQADQGNLVYYQVCMACHGDRGQGLTDEWREVWQVDANCWQSKCHGNDHPPEGFSFPETCCKALIGPGTLTQFKNGQELFDYVAETMPWWNPGYLPVEEFWQVTNFLLRENGAIPDGITLDAGNAFAFNVHPASPPPQDTSWQALVVCALLASVAGLVMIQNRINGA
jgi:hypothetical protein